MSQKPNLMALLAAGSESFRRLNLNVDAQMVDKKEQPAKPAPRSEAIIVRTPEDRLNKTERAYLAYTRAARPDRVDVGIQNVTVSIGWDCRFTPDLTWWEGGQFVLVDVKGRHAWEDSRIKIKAAARMYPHWRWIIAHVDGNNTWREEVIQP